MTAYEELITRCVAAFYPGGPMTQRDRIEKVLAEVLRTLETVTPVLNAEGHESYLLTLNAFQFKDKKIPQDAP
jgi:hypothetical protein